MKRSPLNNAAHSGRLYGARHTPYNWKSHENSNDEDYRFAKSNSYKRSSMSGTSPHACDNFIPLNVSTPMMRHEKYNVASLYSSVNRRNSLDGWHNNYRGNYHSGLRSNCNNWYPVYKHFPKQFHGQKKKDYKGIHKQVNVSAYVDMNSFLEDPWEELVKRLNDSKDISKSEEFKNDFLLNSKLANSDSIIRSTSKLSNHTNLEDLPYSQECKNECSVDTSFKIQNIDLR